MGRMGLPYASATVTLMFGSNAWMLVSTTPADLSGDQEALLQAPWRAGVSVRPSHVDVRVS